MPVPCLNLPISFPLPCLYSAHNLPAFCLSPARFLVHTLPSSVCTLPSLPQGHLWSHRLRLPLLPALAAGGCQREPADRQAAGHRVRPVCPTPHILVSPQCVHLSRSLRPRVPQCVCVSPGTSVCLIRPSFHSKPLYTALVVLLLASITFPPGLGQLMASRVSRAEGFPVSPHPTPTPMPFVCLSSCP